MKKNLIIVIKSVMIVLIFYYMFKSDRLSTENIVNLFRTQHITLILLTCFLFISSYFLAAARLMILLKTINYPIRYMQCFKLTMIGTFFNMIIPGMTGGDLIKGYYLLNGDDNEKWMTSGIILFDRMMGFLAVLFIALFFLVSFLFLHADQLKWKVNVLVLVAILVLFLIFLMGIFTTGSNSFIRTKIAGIIESVVNKNAIYFVARGFGKSLIKPNILICSFAISITMQLLTISGLLVLATMIPGKTPDMLTQAMISSFVFISGGIPITPGNIGWTELVASIGWSAAGSNMGGVVFIYRRILALVSSLPGALFYASVSRKHYPINQTPFITIFKERM